MNKESSTSDPPPQTPANDGLFAQTVRSGFWLFAGRLFCQISVLARLLVLGYFLAPQDFGLLGIALLITALLTLFTETGFQDALVQKSHDIRPYLNTAWTVNLIRNLALFALLLAAAPLVASFFDTPATFETQDLREPATLAQRFTDPTDPTASFLRGRLSPETQRQLDAWQSDQPLPQGLTNACLADLNQWLDDDQLARNPILRNAVTDPRQQERIETRLADDDLPHANRILLEQIFPDSLRVSVLDLSTAIAVIRAVACTFLIAAFTNVGVVYFTRDLQFQKRFLVDSAGTLVNVIVTIILAVVFRNVWALVAGRLAGQTATVAAGYLLSPIRPKLRLNLTQARELWSYGRWVFAATLLGYLGLQGDNLFVAKILGVAALGLYQMAYNLATAPLGEITSILLRITFPAFSRLQNDLPRLRRAYLQVTQVNGFLTFPFAGLIFLLAADFTHAFLNPRWLPMIPTLQVLAIAGFFRTFGSNTGSLFQSTGHPRIIAKLIAVKLIILAILIYPAARLAGVLGVAAAVTISVFAVQPLAILAALRIVNLRLQDLLVVILPPFIATIAFCVIGYLIKHNNAALSHPGLLSFFSLGTIAVVIYATILFAFSRWGKYDIAHLVRQQSRTLRGSAKQRE